MVIVEYCRFGNIKNVLLKNRSHFVNQINSETGIFNPSCLINLEIENASHDEGKH